MREAALADIRRALADDERLHRELELRAGGAPPKGLLPRSVLLVRIDERLRPAFPSRIAELLSVVRPMIWPHGVAGLGFHLDGLAAREETVLGEPDVFPSLTVLHGGMCGMTYLLPHARLPMVIGRGQGCDLRLVDHTMSRRQALFSVDADGNTTLEDLRSTAGSWIGQTLTRGPTPMRDGDTIRLNGVRLRFFAKIAEPA